MRKLSLLVGVLFACILQVSAQNFVSTEPSNRNVIIEEFTGRNCGYCPDGHRIANQIMADNPGRVWAINVHAGGFSPNSYPNLNNTDATTIHNGFSISGYPCGSVNRTSASAIDRGQWASVTNQQLGQPSVLNVGGMAVINPATRLATIEVEVYYTGNSTQSTNYLTVAMLQDSILGSQSGGSSNPSQMVGGQYCHMHILRDVITTSAWGEAITPTTQGTLITKTYTYEIPESIGSPNGVEVDINNVIFLAWVSESQQGAATRPILSACEIETNIGSDEPLFPYLTEVAQAANVSCGHDKEIVLTIKNGGVEALTNIKFEVELEGEVTEAEWSGSLDQFYSEDVTVSVNVPFGSHNGVVRIVEANGVAFESEKSFTVSCEEWIEFETEDTEVEFTLDVMQDKFGNQTTWEVVGSDGTVYASGGPYNMLQGTTTTSLQRKEFTVPVDECLMFNIYDAVGNGICCQYGEGYYQLKDADDNIIIDGDGAFGEQASHLISVKSYTSVNTINAMDEYSIYPNPSKGVVYVKGDDIAQVMVYNSLGQLVEVIESEGNDVVSIENLSVGIYFLSVTNNDGETMTKKVSIVK